MKKIILLVVLLFLTTNSYSQVDEKVIDRLIELTLPVNGPGGALLICKDGKVIYKKAFGYTDIENKIPNTTETIFQIGSISKMMTAAGILLLINEGKLSLSDTLTKFIPDFIAPANKVTIENLLLHNSGIKNYTSIPEWNPNWESKRTLEETIELVKNKQFDFMPGEKFQYNNSGYVILAFIIEKVSGLSFDEYMKKNVFIPLNMNNTRHGGSEDNIGQRAKGHTFNQDEKKMLKAVFTEFPQLSGAGSIISTVDDLLKWNLAMKNSLLLPKELWIKATSPNVRTNFGDSVYYGYGWVIQNYEGHKLLWHNGGMAGFLSSNYFFTDDDLQIIFLSNNDFVSADAIVEQVANYIFNINADKRKPVSLSKEKLKKLEGKFIAGETQLQISINSNKIIVEFSGFPFLPLELVPTSDSTFFVEGKYDSYATIQWENDGTVNGGVYYSGGQITKFFREGFQPKYDVIDLKEDELKIYVGVFEFAPGVEAEIYIKEGYLRAFIKGQPEYTLIPVGNNTFLLQGLDGFKFVFETDANKNVTYLISSQPNGDFKAKKK